MLMKPTGMLSSQNFPQVGHDYEKVIFESNENDKNQVRSSIAIWKIENESLLLGGKVRWNDLVKLRNVRNGSYLHVRNVRGDDGYVLTMDR